MRPIVSTRMPIFADRHLVIMNYPNGKYVYVKELCKRINIEKYSNEYLKGKADTDDIDVHIRNIEDKNAYCFVHINDVQMKFRRIQIGMQDPKSHENPDEIWLLISGFHDEKSIKIKNIREIYFNYRGWETIHG